jgi:nucleotide-binding universal stress UspA family protein
VRAAAESQAAKVLQEHPEVISELLVCERLPAQVLIEQSAEAEMLVVGSRGLGGFRGLLLGSVSQQCAQHARCPVVIVHITLNRDRNASSRSR